MDWIGDRIGGSGTEREEGYTREGIENENPSVEVIVAFAPAIKTAIKYHRVFTNERGVRWLHTRTKPWNTHEEQTVLHFGDRGPPESRILSDTT